MSVVETERPLVLAQPAGPGLRLLPAPDCEPPYDDELPDGRPLPLRPARLRPSPPLRLVPPPAGPEPTDRSASALPPAKPFAQALVQRLLEVAAGVRPVAQLQRDTTLDVYEALERLLVTRPRAAGARPDARSIRSVRVQDQGGGVVEAFATVRRGARYGAIAFRLEGSGGRWRCTQLEGA